MAEFMIWVLFIAGIVAIIKAFRAHSAAEQALRRARELEARVDRLDRERQQLHQQLEEQSKSISTQPVITQQISTLTARITAADAAIKSSQLDIQFLVKDVQELFCDREPRPARVAPLAPVPTAPVTPLPHQHWTRDCKRMSLRHGRDRFQLAFRNRFMFRPRSRGNPAHRPLRCQWPPHPSNRHRQK